MFIIKVSGRTSMQLRDEFGPYEEQLHRNLRLLDGTGRSSFLLFHVPDDSGWPDGPGFKAAEYDQEYLQSAGRADAMTIEIRRLEDTDGMFHQYALGRPAPAPIRPEVEINWGQNSMTVPANEVFDADGAVTIYFHYLQHRTIPDTYTLRELDLGGQPADQHTTAEWTPEPPR